MTGMNSFQTNSSNFVLQEEQNAKILETIVNSRQGLSHNKISTFAEIILPDPLLFGVPTVLDY